MINIYCVFFVFALINVSEIFGTFSEQQNKLFSDKIRNFGSIKPKDLLMNVHQMMDLLRGKHMLSRIRNYNSEPASVIMAHFLQLNSAAELLSFDATFRDPRKLCPMRAFFSAMLSKLSAEFSQISDSEKWHSADVAQGLQHLDMEFGDVALRKRKINERKCAEIMKNQKGSELANLIEIDWTRDQANVSEFVLECIKFHFIHFLHGHCSSIDERIALSKNIAKLGEIGQGNVSNQNNQLISMSQLVQLFKTSDHIQQIGRDGFFGKLLEFVAKITEIKILLKSESIPINQKFESLYFLNELFSFGLDLANLLESAKPITFKRQINSFIDQKWNFMQFYESFNGFVTKFRQSFPKEITKISPEHDLLNREDICKAWLIWHYQQHLTGQQMSDELDEAEVERQCEKTGNTDFLAYF